MSDPLDLAPRDPKVYGALAALLALLWLATLNARPLFNTDEGRYAEIPREMLSGGDWVIPHLNGLAYIEKPPLQYWATALSYRLLGPSAFAARLYCALTALATIVLVWMTARRLWSAEAGWRAAAVLSGMLMFVVLGQLLTLDMSLTFWMTLSLAAFLLAQAAAHSRRWMLVAWAAAGCGVLTKGLVAAAIPVAVLILYSGYSRDFAPWRRLHVKWGLPLFLAITVPWHWLAAHRLPDFLEFFFVHEHLARYLTPSADREAPWWFFAGVFLAGSFPWTLPALALLIAALPAERLKRDCLFMAIVTVAAGVGLGWASLHWPTVVASSDRSAYFLPLAKPLGQIALLLAVSGAFVLAQRVRDATRAAVFLGAGWCLAWLLLIRAAALVAPIYSGVALAAVIPAGDRDAPLYSVGTYDQSLTFYLQRTVTLVGYRGELDYGLRKAPGAEIAEVAEFLRRWSSQSRAFAVMEKSMFEDLKSRGVPMRLLATDVNRVLVARQ